MATATAAAATWTSSPRSLPANTRARAATARALRFPRGGPSTGRSALVTGRGSGGRLEFRGDSHPSPARARPGRRRCPRGARERASRRSRRATPGEAAAALPAEPAWLSEAPDDGAIRRPRQDPAAKARAGEAPGGDRRLAAARDPGPAQPRAGPRGHHDRGSRADSRGSGLGQDASAGPPDRVPRRRPARRAVADPRGDVHEPRRGRAARADHPARRRAGQGGPGRDVPLDLRAGAAARRRGDRAGPAVRHLRHRGPAAAHEAGPPRGGPRGEGRDPAGGDPRRDQPGQERHARSRRDPAAPPRDRA